MNDDELYDLIRQTHPKPEFTTSFQREIWTRAALAEKQSWKAEWRLWSDSLFRWIAQPAPSMAVVSTMLILGIGLGQLMTPNNKSTNLRSAYLASINPVVTAHLTIQK